jgi:hypothetical protein
MFPLPTCSEGGPSRSMSTALGSAAESSCVCQEGVDGLCTEQVSWVHVPSGWCLAGFETELWPPPLCLQPRLTPARHSPLAPQSPAA